MQYSHIKKVLLFIFICLTGFVYSQNSTLNVLFIGNSLTFYNNMPEMVKKLAKTQNRNITYGQHTIGGYSLKLHASSDSTMRLIRRGNWNYVVIQGFSKDFAYTNKKMNVDVLPYLYAIVDSIKKYNSNAQIVLYMTWAYKNGSEVDCKNEKRLCSYSEMQNILSANYLKAAANTDMWVAPVGEVWAKIRTQNPTIELYNLDNLHPSIEGSYVAASVFYSLLFHESVTSEYYDKLAKADAVRIQKLASETVMQNVHVWKNTPIFAVDILSLQDTVDDSIVINKQIKIDVQKPSDKLLRIEIYSIWGELVETCVDVKLPYFVAASKYNPGTYFIKIRYKNAIVYSGKVVI